ncbi:MAG: hypothetical protein MJ090_00340 [Clostridia bacterium]|nr:hypothetical protein [Clostridia bacterium]
MTEKSDQLKSEMLRLLNEKLPNAEVTSLTDEGFVFKKPTRKTAVLIALYKKAKNGDLSAIKELRSIISGENSEKSKEVVKIIEDM